MPRRFLAAAYGNAPLLLTLTATFWAGNFVVGRAIHGHVPPVALSWARWTIAFLIVLPFALPHLRRDWPVIRKSLGILILLGTIGVGSFNTFVYIGLNHTLALNALVLQASGPVLIAITTFLAFGDRVSPRQAIGIVLAMCGVLYMVTKGELEALTSLRLNRGDLWVMAALITWGIYTAYLRKRPTVHWLSFIAMTFLVGALAVTPFFIAEHLSGWHFQPTMKTMLAVGYVSVFPSILAYIFFNRGVELIGGNRAGAYLYLVPLIGSILAIAVLGERLAAYHLIGFILVLAGVILASRRG